MAARPDYKPPLPTPVGEGNAQVAQLVEHATENRSVGGSIPPLGTILPNISAPGVFVGRFPPLRAGLRRSARKPRPAREAALRIN